MRFNVSPLIHNDVDSKQKTIKSRLVCATRDQSSPFYLFSFYRRNPITSTIRIANIRSPTTTWWRSPIARKWNEATYRCPSKVEQLCRFSVYLDSTKPAWNKIRCREISKFDWNNFFRQIGLTIDRTLKFFTVEIFENFPKNCLLS